MSMWIYLRTVEPGDMPADTAGFDAFFDMEDDEMRRWAELGEATWLEDCFFQLAELYCPPGEQVGVNELPVFGGHHVLDPAGGPGHVALDPAGVVQAAAFLREVSFADRWQAWARLRSSDPYEGLQEHLAREHDELTAFYATAAEQGRAVAKTFSF
ncbi:DUF1877 family protein [Kitasatospora sp. NPDC048365]|uniref:DUF1877 family protein n=1 Tax=Kitasatospora sp. NPDC048365 TaxID=3364050 RepID=UPI00371649C7